MCAQGLRSSALLCGKSASKNTVFLPSACVFALEAHSDPLAASQTAHRATVALLFADSSPRHFSVSQHEMRHKCAASRQRRLTLCERGSCLWSPCVRSHGWLRQTVTPSPPAPSASAEQTQETEEISVSWERAALLCGQVARMLYR